MYGDARRWVVYSQNLPYRFLINLLYALFCFYLTAGALVDVYVVLIGGGVFPDAEVAVGEL